MLIVGAIFLKMARKTRYKKSVYHTLSGNGSLSNLDTLSLHNTNNACLPQASTGARIVYFYGTILCYELKCLAACLPEARIARHRSIFKLAVPFLESV
jgi:hypothetical protein